MAAFTLESSIHATRSSLKGLYDFLSDFRNFEAILPADKTADFKVLEEGCSFSIKGITPMTIKIKEQKPYDYILFSSEGLAKFNFELRAKFIGEADNNGKCQVELSGDMNPFIKSMAEKPLGALIDSMSLKLSQLTL